MSSTYGNDTAIETDAVSLLRDMSRLFVLQMLILCKDHVTRK
jgi:hypothetical protein